LILRPDRLTSSGLGGDGVRELGVLEFAEAPTDGSDDFTEDSLVLEVDFRDECTEPRFARLASVSCYKRGGNAAVLISQHYLYFFYPVITFPSYSKNFSM
jgi:hypothetical protein